ncbi:hypothetical protein TH63_14595 [Rufibacter radiotolerans]|uniref:Lipoprotein n=1 Tax=Rufibacter radiotolerans TaxID=1379910 RepID=A0A0H4VUY6_9BACT|nr:hypothetical protein [Rufibacter radiotolerans]AKQ47742.1 hypothetical protein TH63_14595 [Rufibacter radiotolerans]
MRVLLSLLTAVGLCFGACSNTDPEPKVTPTAEDPITTFFPNEVKPALSANCFSGAYYRKVVSSKDVWLGIQGKVVLPTIAFDPARINPAKPQQYLDNPSVYMGGNMGGQETDIGLTWEVIRDAQGNVTPDRKAFRPFLRRTSHVSGQPASYENAPAESGYYWYPGEEVSMSVQVVAEGKLKLIIEGAGKRFEKEFDAAGYRMGGQGDFKRVNAIDQVANEGKPVQATKTKVENAVWKETNLFRQWEGKVVSVPMHQKRFTDMRCPNINYFRIVATDEERKAGAETINISGASY